MVKVVFLCFLQPTEPEVLFGVSENWKDRINLPCLKPFFALVIGRELYKV